MIVVIDANVLLSFLLTRGATISKILEAWKEKRFTLLVTDEILLEIRQVLERFVAGGLIQKGDAGALLARLAKDSQIITSLSQVSVSANKKDNRYLACAKDGSADYLVTGDKKHLLNLGKYAKAKIVSPRDFVAILG